MAGSITQHLHELEGGSPQAAEFLWEQYFGRLVQVARQMLLGKPRGMADEEDVALDALDSLCRGVQHGRFPALCDRHSLWRLLVVITWRKVLDQQEREHSQKRGAGRVRYEADLDRPGLAGLESSEPTPEMTVLMADQCRRLLQLLGDVALRALAQGKLEGYTNAEMAGKLGCSLASIERKLRRIRGIWEAAEP